MVFERKFTHLLCCFEILPELRVASCTTVHSGFKIPCALHMGKFCELCSSASRPNTVYGFRLY